MKVMITVLSLFFFLSCSTSGDSQSANTKEAVPEENYLINASDFKAKINEKDAVVLDVRTPSEVEEGVISNPTIINYRDENFKDQILALDKSKTYLVYCKSGGRSGRTKAIMDENGFKTVYDLEGGITAWKDADFPIE